MRNIITASALGLVMAAPGLALAATPEQDRSEIDELKRQVAMVPMLLARIEQLEKSNAVSQGQAPQAVAALESRVAAVEESNDKQTDQLAQGLASSTAMDWARNIKWKGDFRYRNESFDIEGTTTDQVRDRLRVRFGLEAKVSPTLLVGIEVATGEGRDARSTNSTLDAASQHEEIGLDLAYVDWRPRDGMLFTLGKQKQPWFKGGNSLFFDGDVNPEGASFQYGGKTGPFARAWGFWLEEMSSSSDTHVLGAQFGYALGNGLTLAAGYWDYGAIKNQPVLVYSGTPAGNSTYASNGTCTAVGGAVRCYAYDYDILIADAQWSGRIGTLPLTLFGGYIENMDPSDLNTGYNLGFMLGRAADPRTWELGVMYQELERDAQMAAFVDSDFAGGLTQGNGYVVQGSWAPVKNMTMKATYFINDRNYDSAIVFPVTVEAEYKRLQLDLNYKF